MSNNPRFQQVKPIFTVAPQVRKAAKEVTLAVKLESKIKNMVELYIIEPHPEGTWTGDAAHDNYVIGVKGQDWIEFKFTPKKVGWVYLLVTETTTGASVAGTVRIIP
jgi:hypothetical protein